MTDAEMYGNGEWWIDETGRWNPVDPALLAGHAQLPVDGVPVHMDFVYRWLAMARAKLDRDQAYFDWDVNAAQAGATESIADFLEQRQPKGRIVLRFFFGAWQTETYEDAEVAAWRVRELQTYRDVLPFLGVTLMQKPTEGAMHRKDSIGRACEIFRAADGPRAYDPLAALTNAGLLDRCLVFRRRRVDDTLVYWRIGEDSLMRQMHRQGDMASLIGEPYAQDPVFQRANPACGPYESSLTTYRPRYDHIRHPVVPEGQEPTWITYERLLLPFNEVDGSPMLVVYCRQTTDAAIKRALRDAEPIAESQRQS
jgi:hypothetical protein